MTGKKILIGYGTRFGATEEVAYRIAEVLRQHNNHVQVENLRKNRNPPTPQEFNGVIIASGMKMDKWTKEPKRYIKVHKKMLEDSKRVFGMFICSILAVQDYKEAIKRYLEQFLTEVGISDDKKHIIYDAFGGVMDFSKSSKMGFFDKRALQMGAMEMQKESEGSFQYEPEGRNDFRDWNKITIFAENFNQMLMQID
ncbi:flavodoxin domain-containing protein [Candidatus Hodarchaeum mangrovi]